MAPQRTQTDARPSERITAEVTSWPGVTAVDGRRGEWSFRLRRREIGHLHGDRTAHFMLPKDVFDDLLAQDRVTRHPVFPDRRGPCARRIEDDRDVEDVIAILREQYERLSRS